MPAPTDESAGARNEAIARFVAGWVRATGADHHPPRASPAPPSAGPSDEIVRERVRVAARRATVAYPGAVGELLARELLAYLDLGCRFGEESLMSRIVDDLARPGGAGVTVGGTPASSRVSEIRLVR